MKFDALREVWIIVRGDGTIYSPTAFPNSFAAFPTAAAAIERIRKLREHGAAATLVPMSVGPLIQPATRGPPAA